MKRAVTIPEILRSAGYFTAMSGKWHLSKEPTDFGFDRFFGHLSGACHFFKGDNTFRLNGEPWEVPAEGFYTTIAKVDFALKFLEEARGTGKPWFLYLAFNAPHAPIHPLKQDYEKYRDRNNIRRDLPPHDPASKWTDSTGLAWARNAPFRFYKQNQYEGGIATPAIARWPAGIKAKPGSIDATPAHLVDLLPTLLDVTGAKNLQTFPGREPTPLAGISLAPLFAGEKITGRPPLHFLHDSDRALRDGDWKIVSFRSGPWELYNLAEDRTELHDLAAKHPERVSPTPISPPSSLRRRLRQAGRSDPMAFSGASRRNQIPWRQPKP